MNAKSDYIGKHRAGVRWIQIQGCRCGAGAAQGEIPVDCWERIMRQEWVEGKGVWISAEQSAELKRDKHYRPIDHCAFSRSLVSRGET